MCVCRLFRGGAVFACFRKERKERRKERIKEAGGVGRGWV